MPIPYFFSYSVSQSSLLLGMASKMKVEVRQRGRRSRKVCFLLFQGTTLVPHCLILKGDKGPGGCSSHLATIGQQASTQGEKELELSMISQSCYTSSELLTFKVLAT